MTQANAPDVIAQFKENQKAAWASFALLEGITATTAPRLVRHAGITRGQNVLDVGCGTGVVALTAARLGARLTGIDLTPELVARARESSALMRVEIDWRQGDAEALPFANGEFDVVVSQFGHMFAPRPDVALGEMLRVLKPGGTIAFSTWPPEMMVGRWFTMMARYAPPPPAGVSPPVQWGDVNVVRERLGSAVTDVAFARDVMRVPALSVQHYRLFMERNFGPAAKLLANLDANEPAKAAALRREAEELASLYHHDNVLTQDYLLTRARKA